MCFKTCVLVGDQVIWCYYGMDYVCFQTMCFETYMLVGVIMIWTNWLLLSVGWCYGEYCVFQNRSLSDYSDNERVVNYLKELWTMRL